MITGRKQVSIPRPLSLSRSGGGCVRMSRRPRSYYDQPSSRAVESSGFSREVATNEAFVAILMHLYAKHRKEPTSELFRYISREMMPCNSTFNMRICVRDYNSSNNVILDTTNRLSFQTRPQSYVQNIGTSSASRRVRTLCLAIGLCAWWMQFGYIPTWR